MGVRGLQTFLKKNKILSHKTELNNASLVIDANNLFCTLFCDLCNRIEFQQWRCDIYGGDMVSFGESIREFFKSLDRCRIVPILVYDGSVIGKQSTRDQLALKEDAVLRRSKDRFEASKCMTEDNPDGRIILSQVMSNVFRNVVAELGIRGVHTPYEADTHIARIANDLNCLVLTNDSDFLIYSLPQGFILLDSFDYKSTVTKSCGQVIVCDVYSQRNLIRHLSGLVPENLPLLSVLLGNDYVEAGFFDQVVRVICNQPHSGQFVAETWSHKKIANLLVWLRNRSLEEAIDSIVNLVQYSKQDMVRQATRVLLRNYKIEDVDNLESELQEIYPNRTEFKDKAGQPVMPPAYIRELLEVSSLHHTVLDIIFHNTHYHYTNIDDFQLPSSNMVKYRPYSLCVTLLRPHTYHNLTTYQRKLQSEKDAFHTFDRKGDDYIRVIIRPMEALDNFGSLEHLDCYSMISLDPALKKSLLMAAFRFNADELNLMTETMSFVFTEPFTHEASLCLLLVKYIGQETRLSPKPQFVDALMMTLFYYAALNGRLNNSLLSDSEYGKLLLRLKPHSTKIFGRNQQPSHTLFRRIAHFIGQLQSAFSVYMFLNTLLNQVFPMPRLDKFFNSSLIFHLTKLLRLGELKIEHLCGGLSPLLNACQSVKVMVYSEE